MALSGCAAHDTEEAAASGETVEARETVLVERGNIAPTVSASAEISQAKPFVVPAPTYGTFGAWVKIGDKVEAGSVLGYAGGAEVRAPAPGTVVALAQPDTPFPANWPVATIEYSGFAIAADAHTFLASTAPAPQLTGRFEVEGGLGPSDCLAVVATEGEAAEAVGASNETDTASQSAGRTHHKPGPLSGEAECLIAADQPVAAKQKATAVFRGSIRENVLILPLSAVAGRLKEGSVRLVNGDGTATSIAVKLGATDGARIEIADGLAEGQEVAARAPSLGAKE